MGSIEEKKEAAILACAVMIKGICMTSPQEEWVTKATERIRFMLKRIHQHTLPEYSDD